MYRFRLVLSLDFFFDPHCSDTVLAALWAVDMLSGIAYIPPQACLCIRGSLQQRKGQPIRPPFDCNDYAYDTCLLRRFVSGSETELQPCQYYGIA